MPCMEDDLTDGTRLIVGSHLATIRFVGTVDGQDGQWVGLEWDDPTRGKHDGSHGGVGYFSCKRHPPGVTAGSLIRLSKLLATADVGITLDEAIQQRYKDGNDALMSNNGYVQTVSNRKVAVELVGAEAASVTASTDGVLEQASFIDMRLRTSLDASSHALAFLSNVRAVDLSDNLLCSWEPILQFACALPSLHTLNLSGNALDGSPPASSLKFSVNIRELVLNKTGMSWHGAMNLTSSWFPNLQALYLRGNGIASITPLEGDGSTSMLSTLTTLDLEDNSLDDWKQIVTSLKGLSKLENLLLSGNNLSYLRFYTDIFALNSLKFLSVANNKLSSWRDIDAIDHFAKLQDLRISDNPITGGALNYQASEHPGSAMVRYDIIARISRLTTLNGSTIRPAERWDAELAYLRTVTDAVSAAEREKGADGRLAVLTEHPRYSDLVAKYGSLTSNASENTINTQGHTMASSMVELLLTAPNKKKEIRKKVPLTLTVGRLKPLLERLLKMKIGHFGVVLVSTDGVIREDVTQEDGRELRYYEVENGWRIEIEEREAGAVAVARDAAVAEHARRMEEHEMGLQRLRVEEERLLLHR